MNLPSRTFAAALLALAGCSSPGPITPEAARFDPALIWKDQAQGTSHPMVVDWSAADRGTLENHVRRGPVVVRFSEHGLEPLWGCRVSKGSYEYSGISPKHDRIEASSDAEIAANFPIGFARLSGKGRAGESLMADVRMIGIAELNRAAVYRQDLAGRECADATHVVMEVTVGGFKFGSSATRAAGAGVSAAGVGAEASYEGSMRVVEEEGDFSACEAADPMAREAPARCKGVLRVRLVPIEAGKAPEAGEAAAPAKLAKIEERPACGAGMRWDGSACAAEAPAKAYACDPSDYRECDAQCARGNAASCRSLGTLLVYGQGGAPKDARRGLDLLEKGCRQSDAEACFNAGAAYIEAQAYDQGAALSERGCAFGNARACTNFAFMKTFGRGTSEDQQLALALNERACHLGEFQACSNAGVSYLTGRGMGGHKDPARARELFWTACDAGILGGCANVAAAMDLGQGGPAEPQKALPIFEAACNQGVAFACVWGGLIVEGDGQAPSKLARALEMYDRACAMPAGGSCISTEEVASAVGARWSRDLIDRHACDGAEQYALGCYNAAIAQIHGRPDAQKLENLTRYLKRACDGNLRKACDALDELKRRSEKGN